MTRINCVPPAELSNAHLLAEYRELPRVFKLAQRAHLRGVRADELPQEYTLGAGHVKFFYTKLRWLEARFHQLCLEMRSRGYQPGYDSVPQVPGMPYSWCQDWRPTDAALVINRARIATRVAESEARRAAKLLGA